ncbi:DNA mismatch repair protein MutH [Arsenophonus endosymbiont of Aleurodicus dispersus]|uniref:DNA mismatch repair endonuclease MutH n=1 Tax=Arsenophonus endosymbiont of Aleurodicus dispersus TaxID=235559 RepID=UPI000EB3B296|nr:DNA mismatch repair endonuclease MutH [Arsenophonus endosymbiont of Aleurodicus dispersus]VAY02335.1 DNA mismatch repair protein MutH [Arsenophonus endosymbiont of Aleurodicus dispersus]
MQFSHLYHENEQSLLSKAKNLAGYTMAELAYYTGIAIPKDLKNAKGWVGQLLEYCLGANAGSKVEQDFAHLGIELKTIPINHYGKPLETTFVCVAALTGNSGVTWLSSHVRNKLSRVLWIPIEGERQIPLAKRRVASPLLWSPNTIEEQLLKRDWEELMNMIVLGQVESLTASYGQVLQIRPKAANNKSLTKGIGRHGQMIMTLPRGFYLKKNFTALILAHHFNLPLQSEDSLLNCQLIM